MTEAVLILLAACTIWFLRSMSIRLRSIEKNTLATVQADFPVFTPEQIANCAHDLRKANLELKEAHESVFADPAFKQRPLVPQGELKAMMERCADLQEESDALEQLSAIQVDSNAAVRAGQMSIDGARRKYEAWDKHRSGQVPRASRAYHAWVERMNSENPVHASAIAGDETRKL